MGDTLVLNADCAPLSFLPLETRSWQDAIKLVYGEVATVMHEYSDWEVHSPSVTMKVPSVIILRDYIKPKRYVRLSKRNLCLRDNYQCQYCLNRFPENMLTWDHVTPASMGGKETFENIVMACRPCNGGRGSNIHLRPNREPYKPTYWELVEKQKRFPLWIPDEAWKYYLDWPEENLRVPVR